ncbi:hypothetical protein [Ostreibacterium oceani]|nr:hypothetical protein [Ostreibacterium oceani]
MRFGAKLVGRLTTVALNKLGGLVAAIIAGLTANWIENDEYFVSFLC